MLKIVEECVENDGDTHTQRQEDVEGQTHKEKSPDRDREQNVDHTPKGCAFHLCFMSLGKKTVFMRVIVASRPPCCPPCQPST